jgi:hypothetical protein
VPPLTDHQEREIAAILQEAEEYYRKIGLIASDDN